MGEMLSNRAASAANSAQQPCLAYHQQPCLAAITSSRTVEISSISCVADVLAAPFDEMSLRFLPALVQELSTNRDSTDRCEVWSALQLLAGSMPSKVLQGMLQPANHPGAGGSNETLLQLLVQAAQAESLGSLLLLLGTLLPAMASADAQHTDQWLDQLQYMFDSQDMQPAAVDWLLAAAGSLWQQHAQLLQQLSSSHQHRHVLIQVQLILAALKRISASASGQQLLKDAFAAAGEVAAAGITPFSPALSSAWSAGSSSCMFPLHSFCLIDFQDQLYDRLFQTTMEQVAAVVASAAAVEQGRDLLQALEALERCEMVKQVNNCRLSFLGMLQNLVNLPGSLHNADIVRQHMLVVITALNSNDQAVIDSTGDVLEEVLDLPLVRATLKQPQQVDALLSVMCPPYQGAAKAAEILEELCDDVDGDAEAMVSRLAAPGCLAVLVRALQHGLDRGNVSNTDDLDEQMWLSEPDDLAYCALEVCSTVASVPVLKQMPLSALAHDLIEQLVHATKVQDLAWEAVSALHEHQDWAWVFLASHLPALQKIAQRADSYTVGSIRRQVEEIVLRVQKGVSLAAECVPLAEFAWRDAVVQLAEAHAYMRAASSSQARSARCASFQRQLLEAVKCCKSARCWWHTQQVAAGAFCISRTGPGLLSHLSENCQLVFSTDCSWC